MLLLFSQRENMVSPANTRLRLPDDSADENFVRLSNSLQISYLIIVLLTIHQTAAARLSTSQRSAAKTPSTKRILRSTNLEDSVNLRIPSHISTNSQTTKTAHFKTVRILNFQTAYTENLRISTIRKCTYATTKGRSFLLNKSACGFTVTSRKDVARQPPAPA
jgi:hypothetical protein